MLESLTELAFSSLFAIPFIYNFVKFSSHPIVRKKLYKFLGISIAIAFCVYHLTMFNSVGGGDFASLSQSLAMFFAMVVFFACGVVSLWKSNNLAKEVEKKPKSSDLLDD